MKRIPWAIPRTQVEVDLEHEAAMFNLEFEIERCDGAGVARIPVV